MNVNRFSNLVAESEVIALLQRLLETDWSNSHSAIIKDEALYRSGSVDCNGTLAAMTVAANEWIGSAELFAGARFYFALIQEHLK